MATASVTLDQGVIDFLAAPHKMLINNQWVEAVSGKTFPVYNPATGEEIARVAEGDAADADLAVKAARKAFEGGPWRRSTPSSRAKLVWRIADLIDANAQELAELEALDNGVALGAPTKVLKHC